jgi:hypothetical protein
MARDYRLMITTYWTVHKRHVEGLATKVRFLLPLSSTTSTYETPARHLESGSAMVPHIIADWGLRSTYSGTPLKKLCSGYFKCCPGRRRSRSGKVSPPLIRAYHNPPAAATMFEAKDGMDGFVAIRICGEGRRLGQTILALGCWPLDLAWRVILGPELGIMGCMSRSQPRVCELAAWMKSVDGWMDE